MNIASKACVSRASRLNVGAVAFWGAMAISVTLATACGCTKKRAAQFHLQKIGSFRADSAGVQLDENFYLPDGFEEQTLGLSVQGAPESMPSAIRLSTNLARLRLLIELFHADASSDFYRAEVSLATNSGYHYLWKPDYGVLIGGLEPFPYAWSETKSNALAAYRHGRDTYPVQKGRLMPSVSYRLKLTVLEPIPLTNRCQLWLYSVGGIAR